MATEDTIPQNDLDPDCAFCKAFEESRVVESLGSVVAIKDKYPVSEGHFLILPKRHTLDYFTMTEWERRDTEKLLIKLRNQIASYLNPHAGETGKSSQQVFAPSADSNYSQINHF